MNQTDRYDESATDVCADHENKPAIDWEYNNRVEDYNFGAYGCK